MSYTETQYNEALETYNTYKNESTINNFYQKNVKTVSYSDYKKALSIIETYRKEKNLKSVNQRSIF